jgi:hypothetical protein
VESVIVKIELTKDGVIDVKTSHADAAMVVLILEKAKLQIIENIQLKKDSSLFLPGDRN